MLPCIASNVADLNLVQQCYITICDVCHKFGIRVEQHNMKMLHSMDRFERSPVLEPDAICGANVVSKCLVDVGIDLLSGRIGQVAGDGVFFELELDPYD